MAANIALPRRVLTIQSSVVSGHVGNKSAVFPMQLLGWEVDVLNTVQFSNHTGYGRWGGDKMTAEHLESCFKALDQNGLLRYSHLLTGYIPDVESLQAVTRFLARLRSTNPSLIYLLDPVMGDDHKLYVSPSLLPLYQTLLSQATCATPNDFEASLLTGVEINGTLQGLRDCLGAFHAKFSLPHVVISSVVMPSAVLHELNLPQGSPQPDSTPDILLCAGSSLCADGTYDHWVIPFTLLKEHYEGVGDLFSSLLLARFPGSSPSSPSTLREAAELAIASLQGVLKTTRARAIEVAGVDAVVVADDETAEQRVNRLRAVELNLVSTGSRKALEEPEVVWRATSF